MWCYCRLVYMPMSYLYGKRFVGPITPLILQLREELHTQPYEKINWTKSRHLCAKVRVIVFNCLQCVDLHFLFNIIIGGIMIYFMSHRKIFTILIL